MDFWGRHLGGRILPVDYEQLVESPRATLEPVLAVCGLDWDDACLDFHTLDNRVRTASVSQVRQPLYLRSRQRWHNYATQLQPLRDYLESAGITI
jgi:hypothetical protein